MKKLIALIACVCVGYVAAYAEAAAEKDSLADKTGKVINTKIEQTQRVVQITVSTNSKPIFSTQGKAVIMGADKQGRLVLLTSESLAIAMDGLGDEPARVKVAGDKRHAIPVPIAKIGADNTGLRHHYIITLKGTAFKKLPMLSLQEARKLL